MQLRILCVHIETSPLWAEFVNKNRCINCLFSIRDGLEHLIFDNFDNQHNSFLWPEYFIDFLWERGIPGQAGTSVLCLHYHPETVHCSTKVAYNSEITFLTLHPWYSCIYYLWTDTCHEKNALWIPGYLLLSLFGLNTSMYYLQTSSTYKYYNHKQHKL